MITRRFATARKRFALIIALALTFAVILGHGMKVQGFPENDRYVQEFVNAAVLGNWTYVAKPMFPVLLNESQVLVGQNWSIVCPLMANHSYQVYCYGKWVNNGSHSGENHRDTEAQRK